MKFTWVQRFSTRFCRSRNSLPSCRPTGLDLRLFFEQFFQNHVSGFFGTDVIISSYVLWIFVFSEARRKMNNLRLCVGCNLTVGIPLALSLFLFFRERKIVAEGEA